MGNDNYSCLVEWPVDNNKPAKEWANLPSIVLHDIFLLLNKNDRINASSVCHSWRQALYHPSFWHQVDIHLNPTLEMQKSCYLISACSHLVRHTTIKYTSLSMWCVCELSDLLQRLTDNYNLKSLILEPSHCHLQQPDTSKGKANNFIEKRIMKPLLAICSRLEVLSLGCCEELCNNLQRFLELMVTSGNAGKVTTLGLASVKYDPGNYLIIDVDINLFSSFPSLNVLSVDYDYVNDRFLDNLRSSRCLTRLIVHVHGLWDCHPGTSNRAWKDFVVQHPLCQLRLTLIHSYEAIHALDQGILQKAMPLSHLKVFFCELMNVEILNLVSSWYSSTLRSIMWVDSRMLCSSWSLVELEENVPDPFVMASWTCTKLEEIVLLGYKYFEENIVAIARLRGDVLKRIVIAEDDFLYSQSLLKLREEVSEILGYEWSPLTEDDVHPVIKDPTAGYSDDYLLPIVLADLK